MRLRGRIGNRWRVTGVQRAAQTRWPSESDTRRDRAEREERERAPSDGSVLDRLLRGTERGRSRPGSQQQTDQRR